MGKVEQARLLGNGKESQRHEAQRGGDGDEAETEAETKMTMEMETNGRWYLSEEGADALHGGAGVGPQAEMRGGEVAGRAVDLAVRT